MPKTAKQRRNSNTTSRKKIQSAGMDEAVIRQIKEYIQFPNLQEADSDIKTINKIIKGLGTEDKSKFLNFYRSKITGLIQDLLYEYQDNPTAYKGALQELNYLVKIKLELLEITGPGGTTFIKDKNGLKRFIKKMEKSKKNA